MCAARCQSGTYSINGEGWGCVILATKIKHRIPELGTLWSAGGKDVDDQLEDDLYHSIG